MPRGRLCHDVRMGRRPGQVLDALAARIAALPRPALVGIDGVDGVGKTTMADTLAAVLRAAGTMVVRVTMDGFHHPRAVRYRRGRASPLGYFHDSFDLEAFRTAVLEPARAGGKVRTAVHDHVGDAPVAGELVPVADAVVLVDGVFLQRDELAGAWDLAVFLRAPFTATYSRMAQRDGSHPDPNHPANRRYLEGQELYLRSCRPETRADVVLDVTDVTAPLVVSGL